MRLVNTVIALALLFVGIGVVRPKAEELSQAAWDPVAASSQKVRIAEHEEFDLTESGEYVLFVDGPADSFRWDEARRTYVDVFDVRTNRPIPASADDAEYAYERNGRRSEGLMLVRVQTPGTYRLHLGPTDPRNTVEAGFNLSIARAKLVDDQSLKSKGMRYGGFGVIGLLGIIALSMLNKKS